MNFRHKSNATKIYEILNNEPFFYTHFQIKHLFDTFIGRPIGYDNCMRIKMREAKQVWDKPAEIIALLSVRIGDFDTSSDVLFSEMWKNYPEGKPDCDYICVKLACSKMSTAMELNRTQITKLTARGRRILTHETAQVETEWDERMIASYLKLKQLI